MSSRPFIRTLSGLLRCHPDTFIRTLYVLYPHFTRTFGESEPNCRKFEALSPTAHTLQVAHTGELPENHRESEPYSCKSEALSPIAHTLQMLHTGELPENHRESEPYSHETVALSPELRRQASLPEYTTSGGLRRLKIKHCAELIAAACSCLAVTVPSPQISRRPLLQ